MVQDVEKIVAFCILMQNGDGIITKAPDYIMEKFNRYIRYDEHPVGGLDAGNSKLFIDWRNKWKTHLEGR